MASSGAGVGVVVFGDGEPLGFGVALAELLGVADGFGLAAACPSRNFADPGSPPRVPMRSVYVPGEAQPSLAEQAGPEPRPDQLVATDVDHPGLRETGSSSSADRQTAESHTAVSPLLMTATRSASAGSSVQRLRSQGELSRNTVSADEAVQIGEKGIIGTLNYLPPEYVDGRVIDARGDVYAAGLVLSVMLDLPSGALIVWCLTLLAVLAYACGPKAGPHSVQPRH